MSSSWKAVYAVVLIGLLGMMAAPGAVGTGGLLLLSGDQPLNSELRREVAADLLARIRGINDAIPSLSPSEKKWLERERAAIDPESPSYTGRITNFYASNEATKERAKNAISLMDNSLTAITYQKAKDVKQEVLLWAIVSHYLRKVQIYEDLNRLIKRKVITTDEYSPDSVDDLLYQGWGEEIQKSIVIPFLMENLP